MRSDQLIVGAAGDERRERGPLVCRLERVQPALGEIGDARREVETQQVRKPEDMVADAASIRVMRGDRHVRLMVEQSVDDVRSLAGGWDGNGMVGRMTARDVCKTAPMPRAHSGR
jgi:hypothetical protein